MENHRTWRLNRLRASYKPEGPRVLKMAPIHSMVNRLVPLTSSRGVHPGIDKGSVAIDLCWILGHGTEMVNVRGKIRSEGERAMENNDSIRVEGNDVLREELGFDKTSTFA